MIEKPNVEDYTIPAPAFPWVGAALGLAVGIGLAALFMAARKAFSLITDDETHALMLALLIEVSGVVEAVTLARAKAKEDYWVTGGATAFSLLVSGIYNYVMAEAGGRAHGVTDWWKLWPLALGPLVAVALLAYGLGKVLREYEDKKANWLADRQTWLTEAVGKWETAERQAQTEREKREADERERNAQREERREKRREKRDAIGTTAPNAPTNGTANETTTDTTGTSIPTIGSEAEFFEYMRQQNGTAPRSGADVKARLRLPHTTAYRYWNAWKAQKDVEPIVEN